MMRKIIYSLLISCFMFTIISCGKTTEEYVNDTVSKTNDTVFGKTYEGSEKQCTSGVTFVKNISAEQVKQTSDWGDIVGSYAGGIKKLDEFGETEWETKITLYQRKHSNLGKPSVTKTRDGGYLYSDTKGIAKLSYSGAIEWKNTKYRDFTDTIQHSNGYYYLVSEALEHKTAKGKVYKFNSKGKKIWMKGFGRGCYREEFNSIIESSDGELIIVGAKSHSNKSFSCTFEWYDDAWIIKVDADKGGKIWEKTYGGKNYEQFEDIVRNPNGGYYAIGTACNKKNPPEAGDYCAKNMSAHWMKIDESGNSLKAKFFTNGPNQTGFSITNTPSGGTAWVGLNKKYVGSTALYRAVFYKLTGTTVNYSKVVDLGSGNATSIELTKDGGFIIGAGKNVFKTGSDMKIPTLATMCYRSNKNLCP